MDRLTFLTVEKIVVSPAKSFVLEERFDLSIKKGKSIKGKFVTKIFFSENVG